MTIEQANQYFAALPDGFAPGAAARALPAAVQEGAVRGRGRHCRQNRWPRLLAAILQAQGIHAGLYHAGCEPLSARIRSMACRWTRPAVLRPPIPLPPEALPRAAAELAAAAYCFGEAGCTLAVVELPDAGFAVPARHAGVRRHSGRPGRREPLGGASRCFGGGVMRKESICVTAPEQPKAVLSELIVAAGKCGCELVVPDPEDITFLEAEKFASRVDYGGYTVPLAFLGRHAAGSAAMAVELALALCRKGFDITDDAILEGWPRWRTAAASGSSRSARSSFWMPAAPRSRQQPCCACSTWPRCAT